MSIIESFSKYLITESNQNEMVFRKDNNGFFVKKAEHGLEVFKIIFANSENTSWHFVDSPDVMSESEAIEALSKVFNTDVQDKKVLASETPNSGNKLQSTEKVSLAKGIKDQL
jgi:hypothetical protein